MAFGAVTSGVVTIRGFAFEVTLSEINRFSTAGEAHVPKCYGLVDSWSLFGTDRASGLGPEAEPARAGFVSFDCDPYELPKVTLLCLRLGSGRSLLSGNVVELGLTLLETKDSTPLLATDLSPLFRRVGMFEVDSPNRKFLDKR